MSTNINRNTCIYRQTHTHTFHTHINVHSPRTQTQNTASSLHVAGCLITLRVSNDPVSSQNSCSASAAAVYEGINNSRPLSLPLSPFYFSLLIPLIPFSSPVSFRLSFPPLLYHLSSPFFHLTLFFFIFLCIASPSSPLSPVLPTLNPSFHLLPPSPSLPTNPLSHIHLPPLPLEIIAEMK